jgi:hypothetical protein
MIIEDGSLRHFRYSSQEPTTAEEFVKVIKERFARNSVVLWIDEGFTPKDTSEWDPDIWLLEEPDWSQGTLAVVKG